MRARVLIGHFRKDETQGATFTAGIFVMDIIESMEQILIHRGCLSPEVSKGMLKTVTINGRIFVIRDTHFHKDVCEYEVYVPYELATNLSLMDCACCGNKVLSS